MKKHLEESCLELLRANCSVVLVGENGSGKSFLLNQMAIRLTDSGKSVIAVANTIYDKFNCKSHKFSFVGSRQGRGMPERAIKKAIISSVKNDDLSLNGLFKVLDYVGYKEKVGIKISGFVGYNEAKRILDLDPIVQKKGESNWFNYFFPDFTLFGVDVEKIIWVGWDFSHDDRVDSQIFRLLELEVQLRKRKLLKKLEVVLERNGAVVPVSDTSSGEITLISTLLFISSKIRSKSVLLIDEPENSLHPTWQRDYFEKLLDLFSLYEATVIVATHSPLIVTAAAQSITLLRLFATEEGKVRSMDFRNRNLESILLEVFKVSTPRNHQLSNTVRLLLNDLSGGNLQLEEVEERIGELKSYGYDNDKNQEDMLDGILEIAREIAAEEEDDSV